MEPRSLPVDPDLMAQPFVKIPGTGSEAARKNPHPMGCQDRAGGRRVADELRPRLRLRRAPRRLDGGGLIPDSRAGLFGIPGAVLVTLAVLIHILAMWGDSITRSGNDWGMRAIVLFWAASGLSLVGGIVLAVLADILF